MSPVDFWASCRHWAKTESVDIERVFTGSSKKRLIVVENQDEYDYCWAMQLMYGQPTKIFINEGGLTVKDYLEAFSWVFTTWDPTDRNRI